jgi:DNA-binding PucR family transcriptional regulator
MRSIILIYDEMKELRLRDEWRRQIAKEKSDLAIFPTNRFIDHVDAKDRSVNYYWLLLPITAVLGLIMFWIRRMKGNGTH